MDVDGKKITYLYEFLMNDIGSQFYIYKQYQIQDSAKHLPLNNQIFATISRGGQKIEKSESGQFGLV